MNFTAYACHSFWVGCAFDSVWRRIRNILFTKKKNAIYTVYLILHATEIQSNNDHTSLWYVIDLLEVWEIAPDHMQDWLLVDF
jgi:hypothetical protein